MITCVVTYTIDPAKTREFEAFARAWMDLVGRHGGVHTATSCRPRGRAMRRSRSSASPPIRDESGCVLRYERTFMRPLLPTGQD